MKQKHNCEFWIRGTHRGVVESPLHTLPANTTCLYHLQGLDTAVSPSPISFRYFSHLTRSKIDLKSSKSMNNFYHFFRTSNDRFPDWSHAGIILPPSRYRVWLSLIKFNAANVWKPKNLNADTCNSYLNIWDGQLWTPSNCEGVLWLVNTRSEKIFNKVNKCNPKLLFKLENQFSKDCH